MTEPTPAPDVAGGGSRTATVTSPSAAHVGTSSAARTPAGTNGHHVDGEPPRTNGHAVPAVPGRPAHAASESRTADDVEAGIIALWHTYGESRRQALRDRLVLHYAPLVK